jgi:predicted nucleic acid-binding protein
MSFLVIDPPIVVDASVAVGAVLGEPSREDTLFGWATSGRLLLAPAGFWVEIANALIRGHRLSIDDVLSLITTVRHAGVEVADRGFGGLEAAIVLADRHTLTVYDATYLWLALDVDGELATFDKALIRAAQAEGVGLAIPA